MPTANVSKTAEKKPSSSASISDTPSPAPAAETAESDTSIMIPITQSGLKSERPVGEIHVHVDLETQSALNLKKAGSYTYARHPSTKILCLTFCVDNGPVKTWIPGEPLPEVFQSPFVLCAHNAAFERNLWHIMATQYGAAWPSKVICTMAACRRHNLPAALSDAGEALALPIKKDQEGRQLMLKMSKATYKPKTEDQAKEDLTKLIDYCATDTKVEREISVLSLSDYEQQIYELNEKINNRGIQLDTQTASCIMSVIAKEKENLGKELLELTEGEIGSGSQVAALIPWLVKRGYRRANLQAQTVKETLANPPEKLTVQAKRVLEIRSMWSLGSIAKLEAALHSQYANHVFGLFEYSGGAQTGRFAGRRVQLQNLPRLELSEAEIDLAIYLFRKGNVDGIKAFFGDVFWTAKQLIRPCFWSPKGMIVSDFSQIEARVLAWIAGETKLVEGFARGDDVYKRMASKVYDVPELRVSKSQRFLGKTLVLAAGYGLGKVGFKQRLSGEGVDLSEDDCGAAIATYRRENPNIVGFWYALSDAMRAMISRSHPGRIQVGKLMFSAHQWDDTHRSVAITLPSGRKLFYHGCRMVDGDMVFRNARGLDIHLWHGLLAENVCQAVARDVLCHAMLKMDAFGYEIVGHVHDEVIVQNVSELDTEKISQIMLDAPSWAEGLPLACETKLCPTKRYTK